MRAFLGTLLESFVSSVLISTPLSFVLTLYNVGLTETFWNSFIPNVLIAIAVATVLTPLMTPLARRTTADHAGAASERPA